MSGGSLTSSTMPSMANTTTTSVLAMITPFTQQPSCTDIFYTTSIIYSFAVINYSTVTASISMSNQADPRFTTCQPSGWASVVPESRFSFSPAVCPSGWIANDIYTIGASITTAYCCARFVISFPYCAIFLFLLMLYIALCSGYSISWPFLLPRSIEGVTSPACFSEINPSPSTINTPDSLSTDFPQHVQVHNAYHISWQESDRVTLTPQPPELTCSPKLGIGTWTPGLPVESPSCPNSSDDDDDDDPLLPTAALFFLVVGLPVICIAALCFCCGACFYYKRKERRQKRERAITGPQGRP